MTDGRTVGALAVGGSADYQARWLRDERGVGLPLLLDPEHRVRDTVRSPGVVVLDREGGVRWSYVGTRIGAYPSLGEVRSVPTSL